MNAVGRTDGFYDTQFSTVSAIEPRMDRWGRGGGDCEIPPLHYPVHIGSVEITQTVNRPQCCDGVCGARPHPPRARLPSSIVLGTVYTAHTEPGHTASTVPYWTQPPFYLSHSHQPITRGCPVRTQIPLLLTIPVSTTAPLPPPRSPFRPIPPQPAPARFHLSSPPLSPPQRSTTGQNAIPTPAKRFDTNARIRVRAPAQHVGA